eukprot:TRINITY_DN17669_c0_g1_i1.p1 TRINITY_DN17669_c0_g1~~TRINITY_DN17669_c0_g1_i1.p1  ORF type:complete len:595 (-),score=190.75 TRINITY_DN17669_c0_g1_i1:161-1945(-)
MKKKTKCLKKDPGVPKINNIKKDLQQIQAHKKRIEQDKQRQKDQRLAEREARRKHSFVELALDSAQRVHSYEKVQDSKRDLIKDATFYDPKLSKENSKKAYYREFKKVVEASDIVLEVLDARDPLGCRCFSVEQFILSRDPNKKIILILNKIDLVPKENIEQWLKYLRNFYPTIAFRCSLQEQKRKGQASSSLGNMSEAAQTTRETLGAGALLSLLKQYSLNLKLKTSVTVGIIGYPNVGKSSLINSLKRSRAVGVGATPGFTKTAQEIHLDKHIKLLDSPGIVFSQGEVTPELVLRNAVKLEKVEDPVIAVEALMSRCSRDKLMSTYGLKTPWRNTTEFLTYIATKRGKLGHGGKLDLLAAARSILRDWITGRLPFFSIPPEADAASHIHLDAKVVQNFSESKLDFLEKLDKELMDSLPDVDAEDFISVVDGKLEDLKSKSEAESLSQMMEQDEELEEDGEDSIEVDEQGQFQVNQGTQGEPEKIRSAPAPSQNKKIWEDEENNPRRNQQRRKEQKKQKKKSKARAPPSTVFVDEDESDVEASDSLDRAKSASIYDQLDGLDPDAEAELLKSLDEVGDDDIDDLEFNEDLLMD